MESSGGENSSRVRSSSVGARPRPRLHRPSRAESAAAVALDVRCACQFFQTQSLLPERVNPVGHINLNEFEICAQHGPTSISRFSGSNFGSGTKSERNFMSISSITQQPMNTISSPNRLIQPDHQSNFNAIHLPHDIHLDAANDRKNLRERHASASVLTTAMHKSAKWADTGENGPPLLRQRDPSQSSLVRRRMSEDRQSGCGSDPLNRTLSQSSNAGGRFITQKDPTQSAILKRKMYNQPSASFDAATTAKQTNRPDQWCMRTQPLCIPQNRINSERTFYRDSAEPVQIPRETASPSLSTQPNRQLLLDTNVQPERDEIIEQELRNSNEPRIVVNDAKSFVDDAVNADHLFKRDEDWEIEIKEKNAEKAKKVEEPKNENILKMLEMTIDRGDGKNDAPMEAQKMMSSSPPPETRKMLLKRQEVTQTIALPTQIQIQHVASFDSTLQPMEDNTSEYAHSKLFDNYRSANDLNRQPIEMHSSAANEIVDMQMPNAVDCSPTPQSYRINNNCNVSTPDLHLNYIKQRDPSVSRFTRERYATKAAMAAAVENRPIETSLLPPAGNFPQRRASEQVAAGDNVIQQKDLRTSKLLQRRQRNLSQTSLRDDGNAGQLAAAASYNAPMKMVKTVSFEFDKQIDYPPYDKRDVDVHRVDGVHGRRVIHR